MKKQKTLSVSEAIDKYYNRNKAKLDSIFGNEASAKAHLRNDIADLPATHFRNPKRATELFNDYINELTDPKGFELRKAKQEAIENSGIFSEARQLNNRIDKNGFNSTNVPLGQVNGYDTECVGYYEIKNSDYVLARIRHFNGRTELFTWEFIDKDLL